MPCPMCVRADTIGKSQIRQQMQEDLPGRMNASQIKAIQDAIGPAWQTLNLRDYFAAQALNAFLSAPSTDADDLHVGQRARNNPAMAAEWAYAQADAMLAERAKS